jgi:hypothetical protein
MNVYSGDTRGRRGHDRMVSTNVVSSNPTQVRCTHTTFYDEFGGDLRQVGGFLQYYGFLHQ